MLFGKFVNHPDKLAKTMLAYMVKYLYGGPELLANILPVCGKENTILLVECVHVFASEITRLQKNAGN